jgi:hypothetical protein
MGLTMLEHAASLILALGWSGPVGSLPAERELAVPLPSCTPADNDTQRSSSSCTAKSVKVASGMVTVVLSVRGFSPGRSFGGNGFVSCTAYNSDGQRVGGRRKEWNMGAVNDLAELTFSAVEAPSRVSCQYRMFNP